MKNKKLKQLLTAWIKKLSPIRGVLVFMIVLIVSHFTWKLFVLTGIENQMYGQAIQKGESPSTSDKFKELFWKKTGAGEIDRKMTDNQYIYLLGKDLTPYLAPWAEKTAQISAWIMNKPLRQNLYLLTDHVLVNSIQSNYQTIISHDIKKGPAVNIIWGCTGVKQIYIFSLIILFSRGPWKKKLIFIPIGCSILLLFNIIRIITVTLAIKPWPQSFNILHDELFRYLFYGMIFLLWLYWEEKICLKQDKIKESL